MHLALIVALSLAQDDFSPPPPPPSSTPGPEQLDVPPPPPPQPVPAPYYAPQSPGRMPASERETTIRALREEITDLEEKKSGIGYTFPSIFICAGTAIAVLGLTQNFSEQWQTVRTVLIVGGTAIALASTFWLVIRIVRAISIGNEVSEKMDQLKTLERQRTELSLYF